jgi:membrane associated rhomboid family serine protease
MIPLKDRNPTNRFPFVTLLLIVACVAIYFFVQPTGKTGIVTRTADEQVQEITWTVEHAAIPCELVRRRPITVPEVIRTFGQGNTEACESIPDGPPADPNKNIYLAVLLSMFLHGGLLHLAGNMLFLWIFGNNIEDRMGHLGYLLFYLAGGLAAMSAHVALQPLSTVPVVGASGAIAAVMGAYLVLFPNVRILSIVPVFLFGLLAEVRAKWLLGFWFISQFFISPTTGVAWAAHVGGFIFGAIVALLLRDRLVPEPQVPAWGQGTAWRAPGY